jgi:hypothetical protein
LAFFPLHFPLQVGHGPAFHLRMIPG